MSLLISGVSRQFNLDKGRTVQALKGIDLAVAPGEFICLLGGSGCGKSTLLRLIAGLDQPTTGNLSLDGTAINRPRDEVGIVFQEPRLLPWRRVRSWQVGRQPPWNPSFLRHKSGQRGRLRRPRPRPPRRPASALVSPARRPRSLKRERQAARGRARD